MKGDLEPRFFGFVRRLQGTENINELPVAPEHRARKKADFFFNNRMVIAEVKRLASDRAHKIDPILAPHTKTEHWPVFFGERSISKILEHLPEREQIRKAIYDAVAKSLEDLVGDANRQIRATKTTFSVDAKGVLVVLNDTVDILDPNVMAHKFGQTLLKKESNGGTRYPHVGCVWLICETHTTSLAGPKTLLSIVIANPRLPADDQLEAFMGSLQERWAEFNGVPLYKATMPIEEMSNVLLRPVSTEPEATRIPRSESWRREYRARPHLQVLRRDELLEYGRGLLHATAQLFAAGAAKPTAEQIEQLGRESTALFEEIETRNMDMRELTAYVAAKRSS